MRDICWWLLQQRRTLGRLAAMFYTAAYAAMNVGAFAVVSHFANAGERYVTLQDYEGLGRSSPLLAATFTIFLLSLIGIPMTGGFFAKFYVFSAAVKADLIWLTIIGVINSASRRLLLPAHHRRDVHARTAEASPGDACSAGGRIRTGGQPDRDHLSGSIARRVLHYAQQSAQQLVQQAVRPSLPAPPSVSTTQARCKSGRYCEIARLTSIAGCCIMGAPITVLRAQERTSVWRENMSEFIRRLWAEDKGQDIAEYAVMLAVILVLVVGTIRLIGSNANNVFSNMASSIQ